MGRDSRSSAITARGVIAGAWGWRAISREWPVAATAGQPDAEAPMDDRQDFRQAAAAHPDRPFLRSGKQTYTYGECNRRANWWAAVLTDRGVGQGDVVAVMAQQPRSRDRDAGDRQTRSHCRPGQPQPAR